ncbi:MAG TPA: DUF2505 domain-containing protein [Polyangiaceae bacterium]|jgi:hypothetical protein|nr:DUF2505 domain-containing protein [Polyangiaceae bacterium]
MRKANRTLELDCDADTFWKMLFDDAFIRGVHLDGMGFREIEILKKTDSSRTLRAVPKLDAPEAVAKLLGDRFGYEERATLDRTKNEWRFHMVPNALGEKLRTEGTTRLEPLGDGRVRRRDEVTFECKVFGLGGMIESTAEKQLKASWEKEEAFVKRWLSKPA